MFFKLDEIKGGGNKMDVGEHDAYVFSLEHKESKSGKKLITFMFKNDDEQVHWEDFYLTEKALFRIRDLAYGCGFSQDAGIEESDLIGKKVHIKLKKESFQKQDGTTDYNNKIESFSICNNNPAENDTNSDGTFQSSTDVSGGDPF